MKVTDVRIGFDPGASLTKIIYALPDARSQYLVMEPHVLHLPHASLQSNDISLGSLRPELNAWVKLRSGDPLGYAVGALAKQFQIETRLDQFKYEQSLYKLLATIGVIAQQENSSRLRIQLITLLPLAEYHNRQFMQFQCEAAVKKFYFRDSPVYARIDHFFCLPEGCGLAWGLMQQRGKDWFSSQTVVVLMFGHRNTSCLTFRNGSLVAPASRTTDLGFVKLLQRISRRTAGFQSEAIAETIFDIGNDYRPDHPLLRSLIRASHPDNIQYEANTLSDAIDQSRCEHWQLLKQWLDLALPNQLDFLVIGGGASLYFKSELSNHLGWTEPVWSETAALRSETNQLPCRMADLWQLFHNGLFSNATSESIK
jgi:hypothetical protein